MLPWGKLPCASDTYNTQEAGKRALNLWGSKANQACTPYTYQPRSCRTYHVPWHLRSPVRVRRMFSHDEGVPCVPQSGEGMDARTGGVSVSSYARVFELGVLLGFYHPPPAFV